jgi:iron(III) transport system permease protein
MTEGPGDHRAGKTRNRVNLFVVVATLFIACMAFLVLYPLARMVLWTFFSGGYFDNGPIVSLLAEKWLPGAALATAIVTLVSALISVAFGGMLGWINERTDASLGRIGFLLPIIPLLIPNIALSIGWVFLAAPNVGFLNALLAKLPWISGLGQLNIYSWGGLIFVYALNGVPYAYLIISAAFRNIDASLEEASQISGSSQLGTLWRVSVPAVMPAIVAALMVIVIINLSVYSIPAIIATTAHINLLPISIVVMVSKNYPPEIAEAQILGVFMMAVIALLWLVQSRISAGRNFVTLGGRSVAARKLALGEWKWPARSLMVGFIGASCGLPAVALLIVSVQPYWTPAINFETLTLQNYVDVVHNNRATSESLANSLLLSLSGATIGMLIVTVIAVFLVNREGALPRMIDFLIKMPGVIPHLILALGFLVAFGGFPFYLAGSVQILLLAYIVTYIPPGAIASGAAILQVGRDLHEASAIAGGSEGRTIWEIVVPLALPGILAGWAIVFVHMMGDTSAAAILAGIGSPVIGFAILEIWETGSFGSLAALSTILCVINIAVLAVIGLIITTFTARRVQ